MLDGPPVFDNREISDNAGDRRPMAAVTALGASPHAERRSCPPGRPC